jgi:DNA repair protein RadA/Sms
MLPTFQCTCGESFPRQFGKCPSCGAWDTIRLVEASRRANAASSETRLLEEGENEEVDLDALVRPITEVEEEEIERIESGIDGFDEVLGGPDHPGAKLGSVVLVAGSPGIGKSTLLLQALAGYASQGLLTLYVTGEENGSEVAHRAGRVHGRVPNVLLASTIPAKQNIDTVVRMIEQHDPRVVVVDSLQVLRAPDVNGLPGKETQMLEVTRRLVPLAKEDPESPRAIFVVCHVTKGGDAAGPNTVQHLVDAIVYFETAGPAKISRDDGDEDDDPHRVLRVRLKNRFGPSGIRRRFEMTAEGLVEVNAEEGERKPPATRHQLAAKGKKRTPAPELPTKSGKGGVVVPLRKSRPKKRS